MKLDSAEDKDLIGRALTRKAPMDKAFVQDQVNRLLRGIGELLNAWKPDLPDAQVTVNVPKPTVVVPPPEPRPTCWRFEVVRDGAGRIKEIVARAHKDC